MDQSANADEWELSKENVQPLRQGRKFSRLTEGLQPQSNERLKKIREEKQAFEAEVRTYTGDDPLDVWYRYIRWAEESFPKGGKESNLTTIQERCVALFKDEEKYRNDERYIYAWIKTAEAMNDPLEIYNYMYDQNIGCEVSCFYEAWATILEQLGNNKRADAIYREGIKKGARPLETLQRKQDEFQKRVARRLLQGSVDEEDSESSEPDRQRQVLSQLKATGKRQTVAVNRTGDSIQGRAGIVGGARPKTVQQIPAKSIQIYCDENADPSVAPVQTGEWTKAPHRDHVNKENEKKAGVWNKAKVPQPTKNIPISAVNTFKQPTFSIHVDENDQVMSTPAKMPEIGSQVLSARKPEKPTNYLQQMKEPTKDDNTKPMYCKDKIYCGADEYSFEELRAVRWLKKQEKRQREEEEQRALEECRKKLEAEKQLLLDEAERVRQERLKLREEQHAMLEETRRKLREEQEKFQRDSELQLQRHQQMIELNIQKRIQEQAAQAQSLVKTKQKTATSARQLFDDDGHGNTENISPQVLAQMRASATKQPGLTQQTRGLSQQGLSQSGPTQQGLTQQTRGLSQQGQSQQGLTQQSRGLQFHEPRSDRSDIQSLEVHSGNQEQGTRQSTSHNNSIRTPSSFIMPTGHPSSGESFDRTLSAGPSPTVNTKEAMRLVMGMFNASLELEKPSVIQEDVDMQEPNPTPIHNEAPKSAPSSGLPFMIYDETQAKKQPESAPFKIFEDQENQCPPDTAKPPKRKSLSGILQPSLEVQSDPTQEKDCIVMEEPPEEPRVPFEDDNMDHIESHARDDITLAPVGSHLSFAAAARFASTPFNANSSGDGMCKGLDDSDIAMATDEREREPAREEQASQDKQNSIQDQTAPNTTDDASFRKNLSPIMEGSSEDNDSHGKSQHSQHSTITTLRHASDTLGHSQLHHSSNTSSSNACEGRPRIQEAGFKIHEDMPPIHEPVFKIHEDLPHIQDPVIKTHDGLPCIEDAAMKSLDNSMNEDTSYLLGGTPGGDGNRSHLVDISCYVPPEMDEKTENLMSMSICIADPKDPFDSETIEKFLKLLKTPLESYDNYCAMEGYLPGFARGAEVFLGHTTYTVRKKIGEGGFAKVYVADCSEDELTSMIMSSMIDNTCSVALKVQQPASKWEFYICNEIKSRLTALSDPVDVRPAMMEIQDGYFYDNGSCLVTEYQPHGTLLDLVNKVRGLGLQLPNMEPVIVYMTIELLNMVEKLHKCQIIHGDIKPDNFLLLGFPKLPVSDNAEVVFGGRKRFAKLIDFGQSIDMTKYPPGTTFTAKITTKCFQCIEMKTNRPWTYQTDLFGLAGTIHVLAFDQYMKVYQSGGEWCMTKSFARNWNTSLWRNLFHTLLNVPSCDELPDLSVIRRQFEQYFVSEMLTKYNIMSASFMEKLKSRYE